MIRGTREGSTYSDGNCLPHVTNSKATKWWVLSEGLDAHWLGGNHLDDCSVTALDELRVLLDRLASAAIDLLEELGELAGDVGSVAIQDRSVTSTDLTGVVEDDDLSIEGSSFLGRVILRVRGDVSTANVLDRDVLDVESDVVTWKTLNELFVVHFDGLDFSGDTSWSEGDDHTGYRYELDRLDERNAG